MKFKRNILSFDLESWVYPDLPNYRSLSSIERKVIDNGYLNFSIKYLLEKLEGTNNYATFFIIAEQYEWNKDIIKKILKKGHEIGYHTHNHTYLKNENDLKNQLLLSKDFLEEFQPKGFRSPMLRYLKSFNKILKDFGFKYTSNFYNSEKNIKDQNNLIEIYISCYNFKKKYSEENLELKIKNLYKYMYFGSPYFFPLIPYRNLKKFINLQNKNEIAFHIFFHNWQIIKPKINANKSILLRNPLYLPYTFDIKSKFENLLNQYSFVSIEKFINS